MQGQRLEVKAHGDAHFEIITIKAKHLEKLALWVNNPNKFMACQYLIKLHEARGDKIIVFSDNLYAIENYAKRLGRPFIHSKVSAQE